MLKRRLIATATLGATIVVASVVLLHVRSGEPVQLSTVGSSDAPPPPFPPDVLSRTGPTLVNGQRCTQQPPRDSGRAVDIYNIETLPMLAQQTDEVVVADAVRQVAFWQHRIEGSPQHIEWSPATMTQYHIINVVRGASITGPWLTVTDGGATTAAIPTCKSQTYTIVTDPLPTVNTRYVLFLAADTNAGRIVADASQRFPVVNDSVQTEAYVHPAARATVVRNFTAQPLGAFLDYVRTLQMKQ